MPNNKKGIIEYSIFRVVNVSENTEYEYEFNDYVKLPNGKEIIIDNDTKLTTNYVIHLNSNEIKLPFIVRTRKNGDYMTVNSYMCELAKIKKSVLEKVQNNTE